MQESDYMAKAELASTILLKAK